MKVRLASELQKDSIIDGKGIRTVIWFQGCSHKCLGCQNPGTHSFDGGFVCDTKDIFVQIDELSYQNGITLSGGDPFYQADAAREIAHYAHQKGLNVWAYTGFVFEDILKSENSMKKLLEEIDVLVDGPFIIEKKSFGCKFRGSTNQRIIDVAKSLESGKVCLYEV